MEVAEMFPTRNHHQRMSALGNANEIRTYRANLKRDVKAGHRSIVDLLTDPPSKLQTMKIQDLLMSAPKMGRVKVDKLLRTCRISPSKTVGGMSERQRNEILVELRRANLVGRG